MNYNSNGSVSIKYMIRTLDTHQTVQNTHTENVLGKQ